MIRNGGVLSINLMFSRVVEEMDLTDLYSTYERINSLSPRTLLKIQNPQNCFLIRLVLVRQPLLVTRQR